MRPRVLSVSIAKAGWLGPASVVLDRNEREAAGRFLFAEDRDAYIAAHTLLRLELGRLLQRPPESLAFQASATGKPFIANADSRLRFNLSHTRGCVAIAVSWAREVGVDVEARSRLKDTVPEDVAASFFSPHEKRWLAEPEGDRSTRFLRIWTRKEAIAKAAGEGLALPMQAFDTAPEMEGVVRCCLPDGRHYVLHSRSLPGFELSLAVGGTDDDERLQDSDPEWIVDPTPDALAA